MRAKPYSAPGPSGIPNVTLQNAIEVLVPIIHNILKATIHLGYFPTRLRRYKTVVLQKPGKDDYTIAKSY